MKRLIFDLRDNGGGFFDQSLYLADMFLPKDALIVYLEGRNRSRQDYTASGRGKMQDIAIDVLINENSASSSEIFAGAIQDNDRGKIARYKIPKYVFFIDQFPLTGSGKIQKFKLKEMSLELCEKMGIVVE